MTPPFTRTTCACPDDIANCKKQPGPLIPSDITPITEFLVAMGAPPDRVPDLFRASPGNTIARITPTSYGDEIEIIQIPTITPATSDGRRCIFLMPDDRCLIHKVAPFGCAFFDVHQDAPEARRRSLWYNREIANSPEYTAYRSTLKRKEEV